MGIYCEVCGKQLSVWKKNKICSDRCRAKRSRDKRESSKRAHDIGFTINNWSKLLSQGVITPEEARDLLFVVWDQFTTFDKQISEALKKAEAEAEA